MSKKKNQIDDAIAVAMTRAEEVLAERSRIEGTINKTAHDMKTTEAELERARLEVKRIELVLRERAAAYVDNYSTARVMADRYHKEILPRAERAYELIYNRYGLMQASYPQVLSLQRALYKAEADYVMTLQQVWSNAVILQGFLLSDGLEAPTRPFDVDRPIREFNLPSGSPAQE
jgi:hypothetical protein